jgi:hypothetical protein
VLTDARALLTAFFAQNSDPTAAYWIMGPRNASALAIAANSSKEFVTWARILADRPHPQIEIVSSGTRKAIIEIAHFGAPVTYRAEGRILRTVEASAVPRPPEQRFICELQPEEGRKNGPRLLLKNGEWVHIVIGESQRASKEDEGHVLLIRRGSFFRSAHAPDSGVEMEFSIQAEPKYLVPPIKKRIRIVRHQDRTVSAEFI